MNETKPIYLGEAQLIRWGHNGTSGKTVTIELPADLPRHPFDGLPIGKESGQRMQVVFVAMDDHEQPLSVDQAIANAARLKGKKGNGPRCSVELPAEKPHADKAEGQDKSRTPFDKLPRSQQAALKCQDPEFQKYVLVRSGERPPEHHSNPERSTVHVLKIVLGISSRRELDEPGSRQALAWDRLMTDYSVRGMVR